MKKHIEKVPQTPPGTALVHCPALPPPHPPVDRCRSRKASRLAGAPAQRPLRPIALRVPHGWSPLASVLQTALRLDRSIGGTMAGWLPTAELARLAGLSVHSRCLAVALFAAGWSKERRLDEHGKRVGGWSRPAQYDGTLRNA